MELTFDDFRERAKNDNLSKWEKIGFPNSYREGKEDLILNDIGKKIKIDEIDSILDIGCGCSDLVLNLINYSKSHNKILYLVDSEEMLSNINAQNNEKLTFVPGVFPSKEVIQILSLVKFDSIIVYSVLQYIFLEQNIYNFIHQCIKLLKPGGRLLLGDIPNISSRNRFLNSDFSEDFKRKSEDNSLNIGFTHSNEERIDDSVVFSILSRFRHFNCETYLLPQSENLPFSNRREDILIVKR